MSSTIIVGISDLNIAMNDDIIVTHALGSCVGIFIYDPIMKIAGLAHIMLPTIKEFVNGSSKPEKYADAAIEILIKKMCAAGANKIRLRAKIAGGAQMFAAANNAKLASIGERNVIAVKKELQRLRVPIIAEDTGKNYGRTMYAFAENGNMKIKSINRGEAIY